MRSATPLRSPSRHGTEPLPPISRHCARDGRAPLHDAPVASAGRGPTLTRRRWPSTRAPTSALPAPVDGSRSSSVALLAVAEPRRLLLHKSDTTPGGTAGLPDDVVSDQPRPRRAHPAPVDTVTVELRTEPTGVLVIDGQEIPEDQLERGRRARPGQLPARAGQGAQPVPRRARTPWSSSTGRRQGQARPATRLASAWTFRVGA